ncbi:hypothetical protein BGZ60DRAFT_252061 [Tricladium varicosporioides]|nr:hypothetical protein BGZ60DRAFT_252061 [Hymenoscyphus varicosporioides]
MLRILSNISYISVVIMHHCYNLASTSPTPITNVFPQSSLNPAALELLLDVALAATLALVDASPVATTFPLSEPFVPVPNSVPTLVPTPPPAALVVVPQPLKFPLPLPPPAVIIEEAYTSVVGSTLGIGGFPVAVNNSGHSCARSSENTVSSNGVQLLRGPKTQFARARAAREVSVQMQGTVVGVLVVEGLKQRGRKRTVLFTWRCREVG